MELLTIFFTFLIAILLAIYFYLRRNHGYIEHLGIPIVKPFLCFGSPPFLHHKNLTHEYYERVSLLEQCKNIVFSVLPYFATSESSSAIIFCVAKKLMYIVDKNLWANVSDSCATKIVPVVDIIVLVQSQTLNFIKTD
jgi:hypothetical protein